MIASNATWQLPIAGAENRGRLFAAGCCAEATALKLAERCKLFSAKYPRVLSGLSGCGIIDASADWVKLEFLTLRKDDR